MKRPYATTTIGHLVELTALLGVHWKEMNQLDGMYRAEGNGYSLLGRWVSGLGLVFLFAEIGQSFFKETRIIPAPEVKELCFGNVPTFYRSGGPIEHDNGANPQQTIQTLQLGSSAEISDTLCLLGCNKYTAGCFAVEGERLPTHPFPGM